METRDAGGAFRPGVGAHLALQHVRRKREAKVSWILVFEKPFFKIELCENANAMIIEKPDWVHHSVEDQSAGALQPLMPECMSVYFQSVAPN